MKKDGLKITGDVNDNVRVEMMRPEEATRKGDLIIVLVKAMQLPEMMEKIQGIVGEDTKVLCLLNGLGHEDVLKQYVPERIYYWASPFGWQRS